MKRIAFRFVQALFNGIATNTRAGANQKKLFLGPEMLKYSLCLFALFALFAVQAQKSAADYNAEGKAALENGNPYLAERIFQKSVKEYPTDLDALYLYGTTLLKINEYLSASRIIQRAYNLDEESKYPELIYLLARSQKSAGLLDESLESYRQIYVLTQDKPKSPEHKKAARELATIKRIIDGEFQGPDSVIKNLSGLNTDESDFAPFYLSDEEMIYSSSEGVFDYTENISINLYLSKYRQDDWGKGRKLPGTVNPSGISTANGVLNPDSTRFFYTACRGAEPCKIYSCDYNNGSFGIGRPIRLFEKNFNCSHPYPFKTEDGQEGLLFTAITDSGFGGLDIYLAWKESEGKYSTATNLGPFINSPKDELSPFYIPEKDVLFLSSSWPGGMGENDIFYCYTPDLQRFSQLINLKEPFNSPANDSYFKLKKGWQKGVLVSNREGGKKNRYQTCCNDIYEFDYDFDKIHSDHDLLMAQLLDTIQYLNLDKEVLLMEEVNQLVDSLRDLLPIPLYFHNDEPNPKSTTRTTSLTYDQALNSYRAKREEYLEINPSPQVKNFFDSTLSISFDRFNTFLDILKRLHKITPYPIVLAVRGYASPLAKSDYNIFLSERRIASLQNYFYSKGFDTEETPVEWVINPYGESEAAQGVSDKLSDIKNSVYSLGAMLERRVEVQWLQLDKSRLLRDTVLLKKKEEEEVQTLFYPLGRIKTNTLKKAVIALYNPFDSKLDIAEIRSTCNCTDVHLENYNIGKGQSIPVELEIIGPEKVGDYNVEIMFYPAAENQKPIRVVLGLEAEK
ncbi:MAG: hypothetical protein ACPF8V_07140 [Luteibaculum sp.]